MKYVNFEPSECLGCLCCMTIEDCRIKLDAIRHGGPCFEDDEQCKDCTRCVDICPGHALTKIGDNMVDCQFCKYLKEHASINGKYYHYYCAFNNKEIEDDWENCTNFEERTLKRGDAMNINKAVQNKDEPEAHAYIRAYDHGAVEREVPYVMHLGDTDDIAQALEERMRNCVHFDWDDIDEVHEIIEYVCNILELPEDQQCEQMINRLRGHLAAGESIDEDMQGFVYDLFRKLCQDHNIQYADLDADNIIDAYEYILPKIKKHNGVDTMEDKVKNINIKKIAEEIIAGILTNNSIKIWEERGILDRAKGLEYNKDHLNDIMLDVLYNNWIDLLYNNGAGDIHDAILTEAAKRYMAGDNMTDLEKLKTKEILHVQGGHVIINHCRIPDVWDIEVDHDVAENPLVICYDADNNWLGSIPLEDVKTLETINK